KGSQNRRSQLPAAGHIVEILLTLDDQSRGFHPADWFDFVDVGVDDPQIGQSLQFLVRRIVQRDIDGVCAGVRISITSRRDENKKDYGALEKSNSALLSNRQFHRTPLCPPLFVNVAPRPYGYLSQFISKPIARGLNAHSLATFATCRCFPN